MYNENKRTYDQRNFENKSLIDRLLKDFLGEGRRK